MFQRILEMQQVARAPVLEVIRRQPKEIVLTAFCRMAEQGPFYVFAAFVFTYGTTVLHSSRDLLLTALMVATGLSAVTIPLAGHISDRIGRKRMYLIGAVTMGIFGFVYFAMLNTMIPAVIFARDHPVVYPARHDVRTAGRADRRVLSRRDCATAAPRSVIISRR